MECLINAMVTDLRINPSSEVVYNTCKVHDIFSLHTCTRAAFENCKTQFFIQSRIKMAPTTSGTVLHFKSGLQMNMIIDSCFIDKVTIPVRIFYDVFMLLGYSTIFQ